MLLLIRSVLNGLSTTGSSLLDWERLEDVQHGTTNTRRRIQTLRFDKSNVPALADLAPQAEGTIGFVIPTIGVATGTKDALMRISADIEMTVGEKVAKRRTLQMPPVILRYRSDAGLMAHVRYFTEEGAPFGVGPLPPVAGKATVYRVLWSIQKTLHTLDNLSVRGVLPRNVIWTGEHSTDGGTMAYNASTRTVEWLVNKMPDQVARLDGWFDVELTPSLADVGRFALLVENPSFEADDTVLHERISRMEPSLNTDLASDEQARGKGVVKR